MHKFLNFYKSFTKYTRENFDKLDPSKFTKKNVKRVFVYIVKKIKIGLAREKKTGYLRYLMTCQKNLNGT